MILMIGGITEAAILAKRLARKYRVLLSTATEYGAEMAEDSSYQTVWGKRDADGFADLIREWGAQLIVDCSHPFAEVVSAQIAEASRMTGIPLLRYCREQSTENGIVRPAQNFAEAAQIAENLRGNKMVFSTVGSNHLAEIAAVIPPESIAARVLDRPESAEACQRAGIPPQQVLMARGPFSVEENLRDFGRFPVGVVLTKDSGAAGGTPEKLEAARRLGLPVVMVAPPQPMGEAYTSLDAVCQAVEQKLGGSAASPNDPTQPESPARQE